eukprot:265523_1
MAQLINLDGQLGIGAKRNIKDISKHKWVSCVILGHNQERQDGTEVTFGFTSGINIKGILDIGAKYEKKTTVTMKFQGPEKHGKRLDHQQHVRYGTVHWEEYVVLNPAASNVAYVVGGGLLSVLPGGSLVGGLASSAVAQHGWVEKAQNYEIKLDDFRDVECD